MEAQINHRENMKNSKKNERLKIRASTGDIIIFGGTIIAAAIGAAFVAHRGRSRNDNKGRDRRKNDEDRGLQSLVHLGKEESSVDSLMENKGKEGLSIEFHGEEGSERGEDGSEGLGDSSTESSNEAVWPAEVIEQEKEIQSGSIETKNQQNEGVESLGMGIQCILPHIISNGRRDEEFGFHDSVEIPETKYIVTMENPIEVNANVSNVVVNDFSFWSDKQNAPPGHTEQYIEESDIAHVTKNEVLDEGEVEKEEISKTNEIKQQLEISETTRGVFASEHEKDMGVLENLLPSSICLEQRNGQVSIDKSDVTKEEEEDLNSKSQKVTEFHGEDVGERRAEDSEGSRNSLEIPNDRSACQEDTIEQEKTDNSMLTNEVNDQFDIPRKVDDTDESAKGCANDNNNLVRESLSNAVEFNMLDDETSEILEELKISHIEVDLVEEEEEEGDQSSHIDGVENEEENGGDGIAHLNVEAEEGNGITNIEVEEVEEDENGGDGVVIEVENEERGDGIADIEIEEQQQKGGDDITNIEEEEEEIGGDQSSHIDGVENEEEKGGHEITNLNVEEKGGNDITNIEVEKVEEDESGGDGVVTKVENEARDDNIANIEIEEVAIEVDDKERVDDITHIEVEEEQPENGDDITRTKVVFKGEVREDGIAHTEVEAAKELKDGDEDKKENEGEGIAHIEDKGADADEAKEEKGGDANTHVEVVEEEEQKQGDSIAYTKLEEEIADEVEEEEEKGNCNAHIEMEEEIGDDSRHKETEVAVEEKVKEEEKEGDDTTHTEVQKEEEEERGHREQQNSSLKSREIEMKSPVEEENEMQESITENTSMEFDGKEVWTAEEGKLEKHSEPMHEMNEDLENPEMIDQMVGMPPAERDENTNGGIQSFPHHNDKNVEVVDGMSVAIQEKDRINLDLETESQNTCSSFETVANTDHRTVMKECPYGVEISNFSQYENEQDLQEPDASRVVEEEDKSSIEAEIESYIEKDAESTKNESEETIFPSMQIVAEAISQTKVSEEEKRLPFIENEMKLMSEIRKMTADEFEDMDQVEENEQEHEPKVTNKESEMTVICKEKKMDFILSGHSKGLFFFVLALALGLGLLALAHHGQLHDNHHRLHKIYHLLYQFIFPSFDGPLDEF